MSVICLRSSPQRYTMGGSITHYKVKNSSTDFILRKDTGLCNYALWFYEFSLEVCIVCVMMY